MIDDLFSAIDDSLKGKIPLVFSDVRRGDEHGVMVAIWLDAEDDAAAGKIGRPRGRFPAEVRLEDQVVVVGGGL